MTGVTLPLQRLPEHAFLLLSPLTHKFTTSSPKIGGIPGSRLAVGWREYRLSASRPACFPLKVSASQVCSMTGKFVPGLQPDAQARADRKR